MKLSPVTLYMEVRSQILAITITNNYFVKSPEKLVVGMKIEI
ncbi:MAG: hypothetical protein U7127_07440 [Phormidium sp.]